MTTKTLAFVCFALLVVGTLAQRRPKAAGAEAPKPASSAGSKDRIEIVSQTQDINPDGSFSSAYETSNGIVYQETGELKKGEKEGENIQVIKGSASWTDPSGEEVKLSWTADENGAVFEGDHLPTPPPTQPIPEAIQRALDYIAAHPSEDSEEPKPKAA